MVWVTSADLHVERDSVAFKTLDRRRSTLRLDHIDVNAEQILKIQDQIAQVEDVPRLRVSSTRRSRWLDGRASPRATDPKTRMFRAPCPAAPAESHLGEIGDRRA